MSFRCAMRHTFCKGGGLCVSHVYVLLRVNVSGAISPIVCGDAQAGLPHVILSHMSHYACIRKHLVPSEQVNISTVHVHKVCYTSGWKKPGFARLRMLADTEYGCTKFVI